jgi:putative transposase
MRQRKSHPLFVVKIGVRQLIEAWMREYNERRLQSSLDDRTPSEFASQYAASRVLAET